MRLKANFRCVIRSGLAVALLMFAAIQQGVQAQGKPVVDNTVTPERKVIQLRDQLDKATTNAQKRKLLRLIAKQGTFQSYLMLQENASDPALKNVCGKALKVKKADVDNPSLFTSLFDGKTLSGWKGLVENPIARSKMSTAELAAKQQKADEAMRRDWKVENGLLVYVGSGYDNICTVGQYGDFELYLDWKLDPNGKDPDAGVYLRGTPQVQIWDTARVNVGAQVGSGGLYNNKKHRSTPLVVADNALGQWNTFFIRMVGDHVTVRLNGILVVDNVVLENYWDRSLPIFPIEQIELQAHGSRVYYRDIYVRKLN